MASMARPIVAQMRLNRRPNQRDGLEMPPDHGQQRERPGDSEPDRDDAYVVAAAPAGCLMVDGCPRPL
jgi:hypothetical protein